MATLKNHIFYYFKKEAIKSENTVSKIIFERFISYQTDAPL